MTVSISGTNGVTFPDSSLQAAAASPYVLKNRIINGDMRIDQRNAGASVTGNSGVYTLDRYEIAATQSSKLTVQQNAGSVTPPTGFTNYLGITSSSAYSITASDYFVISQYIEGYNVSDLSWGTANAKTVTLSFWVRSSLTGTFGGQIANAAYTRTYPYSYTISSANTWEYKTITIVGDTSGTWGTGNGRGVTVSFGLGVGSNSSGTANTWSSSFYLSSTGATSVVGTNGATWYITGVQLEIGTSATPFERRLYTNELQLCQRYYYRATNTDRLNMGLSINTTNADGTLPFPTTMRTAPTALEQSGTASHYTVWTAAAANTCTSVPIFIAANIYSGCYRLATGAAQTTGQSVLMGITNTSGYLGWSAEL